MLSLWLKGTEQNKKATTDRNELKLRITVVKYPAVFYLNLTDEYKKDVLQFKPNKHEMKQ